MSTPADEASADKGTITKLEVNGVEHSVLVNPSTGETIRDLGPTGEKPPRINVNVGGPGGPTDMNPKLYGP